MRYSTRFTLLVASMVCLPSTVTVADPLPERFTLGRYVPADVWMYIHNVRNPEREWLDAKWAEVFDAVKKSGVHKDLLAMIQSVGGMKNDETQPALDKWGELIAAVRWRDLFYEETAFAERIGGAKKAPVEYMLLTRGKAGTADANIKALVAVLEELAGLSDKLILTESKKAGVQVWSLAMQGKKGSGIPFSLQLFRKGDLIGATSGERPLYDMLRLIRGKKERPSIQSSPRFTGALRTVEAPEQGLLFFDFKALVAGLNSLFEMVAAEAKPAHHHEHDEHGQPKGPGKEQMILAAFKKAIELFDVMDYSIHTFQFEDRRELVHETLRFQKDKRKCALTCCFLDRKPFKKFDQYIPMDATSFSVTGLVDFEKIYDMITGFVRDSVPDGENILAKWNGILASVGFDPKEDFFSWWSGEMISVSLPPAVVTPMSQAESVMMFRVKDGDLATKKLDQAITFVNEKLQTQGQPAVISPAATNVEGFRQISHPMLMMAMMRPVFGVKDDWLIISSSADSLNRCLDVAAGKAPSIAKNERFRKEGLIPKGPVQSCSFSDTSTFGQDLAKAAGMMGMFGQMFTAQIPDEGDGGKIKTIVQKIAGMAMKLVPALQKIDFYSSEASMSTYDGSVTLRTERVITYKPPEETRVKTAGAK